MDDRRQEMIRQNRMNRDSDTARNRSEWRHNPNGRPSSDSPPPPHFERRDTTRANR
jgi:hypothetical protein